MYTLFFLFNTSAVSGLCDSVPNETDINAGGIL